MEIEQAYAQKGYKFYTNGIYNPNIFGIRSNNSASNKFDDIIGLTYFESPSSPKALCFIGTTDPGKYWLQNPSNREGTLILVPAQYSSTHCIGIHGRSGKTPYEALEQVGQMRYVRDNNKDVVLDFDLYRDVLKLQKNGFWGIPKSNIHRASQNSIVQLVEKYSAGCQVIQNNLDFQLLMNICRMSVKQGFPNRFGYTLFEESEVWK